MAVIMLISRLYRFIEPSQTDMFPSLVDVAPFWEAKADDTNSMNYLPMDTTDFGDLSLPNNFTLAEPLLTLPAEEMLSPASNNESETTEDNVSIENYGKFTPTQKGRGVTSVTNEQLFPF
jgi:hypothetical protein